MTQHDHTTILVTKSDPPDRLGRLTPRPPFIRNVPDEQFAGSLALTRTRTVTPGARATAMPFHNKSGKFLRTEPSVHTYTELKSTNHDAFTRVPEALQDPPQRMRVAIETTLSREKTCVECTNFAIVVIVTIALQVKLWD